MSQSNEAANNDLSVASDHFALSEDHLEEGTDLGSIRVHNNVIATIARLAATKIPGVAEMSGTLVDEIAGIIGKKNTDRGIRVEVEESMVTIDLHVVIEYGVRIPQISWQLQNDVREAVEQMTGKHVKSVNIVIQSVRMPNASAEPQPES